jgi:hypothetical protein
MTDGVRLLAYTAVLFPHTVIPVHAAAAPYTAVLFPHRRG